MKPTHQPSAPTAGTARCIKRQNIRYAGQLFSALLACAIAAVQTCNAAPTNGTPEVIVFGEGIGTGDQGPMMLFFQVRVLRVVEGQDIHSGDILECEWRGQRIPGSGPEGVKGLWRLKPPTLPNKRWSVATPCPYLNACVFRVPADSDPDGFARAIGSQAAANNRFSVELAASLERLPHNTAPFRRTARALIVERPGGKTGIFRHLSRSANPAVRTVGTIGLLRDGDNDALAKLDVLINEAHSYTLDGELKEAVEARIYPDPENIRLLGKIASSPTANMFLKRSVVSVLQKIHTKDTLTYFIECLDSSDAEVRLRAFSGLSMFVDNLPVISIEMIPTGTWMRPVGPGPWRNPDTDKHVGYLLPIPLDEHAQYAAFWRQWWILNKSEILK